MEEIAFTKVKLPYGWLGNMSAFPVEYNNKTYLTTEALFQALRFSNHPDIQELIRLEKSPMSAKMIAKSKKEFMDEGVLYSDKDIENMRICLLLKLAQYPELKKDLLDTKEIKIIEDCSKRPHGSGLFWGAQKTDSGWNGKNTLGVLWMEIRNSFQKNLNLNETQIEKEIEMKNAKQVYHGLAGSLRGKLGVPFLVYENKEDAKEFANNYTDLNKEPKVVQFNLESKKVLDLTSQEGLKTLEKTLVKESLTLSEIIDIKKDQSYSYEEEDKLDYDNLDLLVYKKFTKLLSDHFDVIKGYTILDEKKVPSYAVINTEVLTNKEILEIEVEGDLWKVEFKKNKM